MIIFKAYISGWKKLLQLKKMWLALYALQIGMAILAAIPISRYLGKTVGHSLDITNSLGRFDYTFFTDFRNAYGSGFMALLNQSVGYIVLYFLVMLFLTGGILAKVKSRESIHSDNIFFKAAGLYFWRLFRLSFYFLLLHAVLFGIFGFLFLQKTNYISLFELEDELIIIDTLVYLLPVYLFLASILFMIHDIAKVELTLRDETLLTNIVKSSFQKGFRHFLYFYPYYLLMILSFVLLSGAYTVLHGMIAPTSFEQVATIFLLGQLYLFLKLGLKVAALGGLFSMRKEVDSFQ